MAKELFVSVKDRIATKTGDEVYICGNSDYTVKFDFDSEWDGIEHKTARFDKRDGTFVDQVFTGNVCPVPVLSNIYAFNVGVFAGNLYTTTPAYVPAKKSILCGGGLPDDPKPDVYAQIMALLNSMKPGGSFSEENAGKLVVIGADGKLIPITLGSEFEIVDGVLRINGQIAPPDEPDVPEEPDEPEEPETPVNVVLTVDQNGNATLDGATVTVAEDGAGTLENATLTVDEDGNGIIE